MFSSILTFLRITQHSVTLLVFGHVPLTTIHPSSSRYRQKKKTLYVFDIVTFKILYRTNDCIDHTFHFSGGLLIWGTAPIRIAKRSIFKHLIHQLIIAKCKITMKFTNVYYNVPGFMPAKRVFMYILHFWHTHTLVFPHTQFCHYFTKIQKKTLHKAFSGGTKENKTDWTWTNRVKNSAICKLKKKKKMFPTFYHQSPPFPTFH